MPSVRKHRKKKCYIKMNRKKEWQKLKKKLNPRVECKQIREAWDSQKSTRENLCEMGIAVDANKAVSQPVSTFPIPKLIKEGDKPKKIKKPEVIKEMEIEASLGEKVNPFSLPIEDVHFCTYMMDKHEDKYKAMARDRKNMYQLTPAQIRNKLRAFKRTTTQYKEYMERKRSDAQEMGEMDTTDT